MTGESTVLNARYELLERAGVGGMAAVFKARDLMLGRLVAVKVLRQHLTRDAGFVTRFQHEAHAAANLAHPNIVTVHDIGRDRDFYYIVMEYVDGRTLKTLLRSHFDKSRRALELDRALDLTIQICAGIGYAHRANLVHCDVKPQNILVSTGDLVKVADFGIAKAFSQSAGDDDGEMFGTPQYFSPEQAAGLTITPASDVYSIGIMLFEMLGGRLPFEGDSYTALAEKHLKEPPPSINRFNPAVPPEVARIIVKVLSKEPSGRYRTADQLGRILTTYRRQSMGETGPPPAEVLGAPDLTERQTMYYRRPAQKASVKRAGSRARTQSPRNLHVPLPEGDEQTDWTAIVLALIAVAALLGLIPLWYLVYIRYVS